MNTSPGFLFTYGTLMQGFDNPFAQKLRDSSIYCGEGSFPGLLYRISWYPGAIMDHEGRGRVYGEIYRIDDTAGLLPVLDEYEDVLEDKTASLYIRKIVPITLKNGTNLDCWVYLYNQSLENLELIQGGNFRNVQNL